MTPKIAAKYVLLREHDVEHPFGIFESLSVAVESCEDEGGLANDGGVLAGS